MQIVQPAIPFSVNYTAYDQSASLNVAFQVYNITTGSAVFVQTLTGVYAALGVYGAEFTGASGQTYLIIGANYTNSGHGTVDTTRSTSCDTYQCQGNSQSYFAVSYGAYDQSSSLYVQSSVYNITTGTPTFVQTINHTYVALGVYFCVFNGTIGNTYVIGSAVYTSNTYATPDPNRAPICSDFNCFNFPASGSTTVTNVLTQATLVAQDCGQNADYIGQPVLTVTQGDTPLFNFLAETGLGPFNLTNAVFTTYIMGPLGALVTIPNSQHTANGNQTNYPGEFTMSMMTTDTAQLNLGSYLEIVTQVVQGSSIIYFHGKGLLNVLPPYPIQ